MAITSRRLSLGVWFVACRRGRFRTKGFEKNLSRMTMPCLLYTGDADPVYDPVKIAAAAMPNANFFSLPGYGHVQGHDGSSCGAAEGDGVLAGVTGIIRGAVDQLLNRTAVAET
jgi:hypothetical protein